MVVAPPAPPGPDVPLGLVEWLLDGKVLRPGRIAAVRQRLEAGDHPDPRDVADAVVRETATGVR